MSVNFQVNIINETSMGCTLDVVSPRRRAVSPPAASPVQARLAARKPPARGEEIKDKVAAALVGAENRAKQNIEEKAQRARDTIEKAATGREFRAAADAHVLQELKDMQELNAEAALHRRAEQQVAVAQRAGAEQDKLELAALRREHAELKQLAKGIESSSKENDAATKRTAMLDATRAKAAAVSAKVERAAARVAIETRAKAIYLDTKMTQAEERHAEHLAARVATAVQSSTPRKSPTRSSSSPSAGDQQSLPRSELFASAAPEVAQGPKLLKAFCYEELDYADDDEEEEDEFDVMDAEPTPDETSEAAEEPKDELANEAKATLPSASLAKAVSTLPSMTAALAVVGLVLAVGVAYYLV